MFRIYIISFNPAQTTLKLNSEHYLSIYLTTKKNQQNKNRQKRSKTDLFRQWRCAGILVRAGDPLPTLFPTIILIHSLPFSPPNQPISSVPLLDFQRTNPNKRLGTASKLHLLRLYPNKDRAQWVEANRSETTVCELRFGRRQRQEACINMRSRVDW